MARGSSAAAAACSSGGVAAGADEVDALTQAMQQLRCQQVQRPGAAGTAAPVASEQVSNPTVFNTYNAAEWQHLQPQWHEKY
jgi:hypothetical protein